MSSVGKSLPTQWLLAAMLAALSSCGGDGSPSMAASSEAKVSGAVPGSTPFIEMVQLNGTNLPRLASINYVIAPRPGASAKPVNVTYSVAALARRGYSLAADGSLGFPLFGLYAGSTNTITIQLEFRDGS